MKRNKRVQGGWLVTLLSVVLIFALAGCASPAEAASSSAEEGASSAESETASSAESEASSSSETESDAPEETVEKNGEIYILYTSDVHCGIDSGFGYAGLTQIREQLEKKGYTTILADNGDAIQGEVIGTLTKGEPIIELMNAVGYDVAIPGNHEFDYGVPRFLELTEKAEFPYISCNFNHNGELLFAPYLIKEVEGQKIAFVGVTTPTTLTTSMPTNFQDENGEFVYGFLEDATGEALYTAVQKAVDDARAEGADKVFVLGHLGMKANESPWTYAEVIENTSGIDAFFDGHSHDLDQVEMKNKDGEEVTRIACGTKLNGIGYSHITAEGEIDETGIWTWANGTALPELLGVENAVADKVVEEEKELEEVTARVIAQSEADLTIYDPEEKDASGNPIRMVRRAETNLADFCTDAVRVQTGAQIALFNGGGIRDDLKQGDVTYGDVLRVWPFVNSICVIEATGQQILDALEWGARFVPDENGGFLQASGLQYEIDVTVPNGCVEDEEGMMVGIEGERRVKNVLVDGAPIDPNKTYTVAGANFTILEHGDGHTAFDGVNVLVDNASVDHQMLIDYLTEALGGVIGEEYADPYGQGRIVIQEG